ncbi:phosphoketolase [Streptomyces sp. NBC_01768]|uniref:phosphoketolase family protein n=1 Tax=Streptomyces sp. NBC_01768 TaxID=2975938 RepID=UPI002DDBE9EF|nr:phosphoketolase [Streptomyces sp. NBC_01768]WSC32142.1 phosphoketolase [Streptomyces sp. NBC_01768]
MTETAMLPGPVVAGPGGFPDWSHAAVHAAAHVPDAAVTAAWRALNYLCAAQLYLDDNVLPARPLRVEDVKKVPSGHWGVCPPVNFMLAHLGPLTSRRPPGSEVLVVHGAGHAGPSALAHAYLTKTLALTGHVPGWSADDLRALAAGFPHTRAYGGEITPLIPGVRYTGGQLGPALAVAQGMVLDAPHRLVVALLGDGELETGAAAAAWTARRALFGSGLHGAVLPVVLANGLRMGGPSVLAGLDKDELRAYFTGLGYEPFLHDGSDMAGFRTVLAEVFARLRPLGAARPQPVLVLTMPKGATGPDHVAGRQITGTPAVHKTPLKDPAHNREEFDALAAWLGSYGPGELFTGCGQPSDLVGQALLHPAPLPRPAPPVAPVAVRGAEAWPLVSAVIRERAAAGAFRLFSPDEAASNRLRLAADCEDDRLPAWASEILNEEISHAWLQGYTETGRDALLATYEAFAAVNTSLLVQHLKHRSARTATGGGGLANINYLITSLGWRNTYTHQNPGLVSAMLETQNPTVHVYTPADATRAAAVLAVMLAGRDRANFLIADKHHTLTFPPDTLREELTHGAAIWPHLSTPGPPYPDIVLASAGDVAARELSAAARRLAAARPDARIRYVHINDLTVLGHPGTWPAALPDGPFASLFPTGTPVLLATVTQAPAVRALLAARDEAARVHVVGYHDPGRPLPSADLLEHCGMSAAALTAQALSMLKELR